MKTLNYTNWDDLSNKLLKKPGFKAALKELEPEYQIAVALIKARTEKGYTQADLAKAMDTKQSVISRVENAKTTPTLSFLKRLAKVLGTPLTVQFG